MGDGNKKIWKNICGLSPYLYKLLNGQQIEESILKSSQSEYYQCNNSCYNGNQNVHSFMLCKEHILKLLTQTALDISEINEFTKFCYYLDTIKMKAASKYDHILLQQKLDQINKKKKGKYHHVIKKLEQCIKIEKKRHLCDKNNISHDYKVQEVCERSYDLS